MDFEVHPNTVLLTVSGSVSYGMETPTSDVDVKGVCIVPEDILLGFGKSFEQTQAPDELEVFKRYLSPDVRSRAEANGYEGTIFELKKFFQLASKGNPNILECLFCDDGDVLLASPEGQLLRDNRDLFLSQVVRYTYSGYACAQLKRIKGHRAWLLAPRSDKPTRKEFGLTDTPSIPRHKRGEIEAAVTKQMDHLFTRDQAIHIVSSFPAYVSDFEKPGFIGFLNAERAFEKAMEDWARYETWKKERNAGRAELEAKYGYDTKHGAHLVRLLRTGSELLTTGKLLVKRPDADELLAIRRGAWSYDQLIEYADAEVAKLEDKTLPCALPRHPDMEDLNGLCIELQRRFYRRTKF